MIVRITFLDKDGKPFQVLFGNNYKKWWYHLEDYLNWRIKWFNGKELMRRDIYGVTRVETSQSAWIKRGGLKWCSHDQFQPELNREGCQDGDPDNAHPREYGRMRFKDSRYCASKARRIYRLRRRHLEDLTLATP